MEYLIAIVLTAIVVGLLAAGGTYIVLTRRATSKIRAAEKDAQRVIEEAEAKRRELILEGRDEAIRVRDELEREYAQRRKETDRLERRLQQKEEQADRRLESLDRRERKLQTQERELDEQRQQAEELVTARREELARVAQLTMEEARALVLRQAEEETRDIVNRQVRDIEQEAKLEAVRRSQMILATTIQRIATDYVAESTVTVVPLPSDDMKGRIIGREGRNIRALEQATGVDLIVDDTPEAVTLSSFDPVRREVARRALLKLIQDGRIHPARIEEIVNKTRLEVEQIIREEGERVALEANVQGLHPDLIKLLGRLKYRTSYGQNVLQHSLEVSKIATALAADSALAAPGPNGPAYNVSTGVETSVNMLAEGLRVALRFPGAIEHAEARDGDVEASVLSPEKAAVTFGWRAAVELQSGLAATAAWFAQQR